MSDQPLPWEENSWQISIRKKKEVKIKANSRRLRTRLCCTQKKLGHAGGSFNDVTTKLLPIQKNHQEKQKQLQQQESGNNIAVTATADIFLSLSVLFESDRQELAN
jgi:hypothetical protein